MQNEMSVQREGNLKSGKKREIFLLEWLFFDLLFSFRVALELDKLI